MTENFGGVRISPNFRGLNKMLKRKPMFFHCLMLDNESRELCTINIPFGLYRFNRLPQGAKVSPDLAQAIIKKIVQSINVDMYIGDYMLFTDKDFKQHIESINKLLSVLAEDRMKYNPLKCAWEVQETSD